MAEDRYRLADGFGERQIVDDPDLGLVEVLDLSPAMGARPVVDALIEGRAARMAPSGVTARVHRLERRGSALRVTAELPRGVRLSTLLDRMAACPPAVPSTTTLSITLALARAVAAVHRQPGGLAHGAICPDHVMLMPDGSAMLTDAAFGSALDNLHCGRERLWESFGLALPWTTAPARFDQRTDLAQMAGVVLALALGRPLARDDYPHRLPELVASAMAGTGPSGLGLVSDLRGWLQRSLQLPSQGVFASAVDAERSLARFSIVPGRETSPSALRSLVHDLAPYGTPQGLSA